MIVFDDADLESVVPQLAAGITTFAGEFCMTGSRILMQRGVAEDARARLADILENVRVGNGLDPETEMGPLIDKANVSRVDGHFLFPASPPARRMAQLDADDRGCGRPRSSTHLQ